MLSLLKRKSIDCCYSRAEELEKTLAILSQVFEGFVRIAGMDYSDNLPDSYKAGKYPAIMVVSDGGKSVVEYTKSTDPQDLHDYLSARITDTTKQRLQTHGFVEPETYVVTLSDANFTSTVQNSEHHHLVEFYAPWCGHCKKLAPEWKDAAKMLRGKVVLAAVDCTVNTNLASEFGIKGFPTIKFIPAKSKNPLSAALEYDGGRTAQAIVHWAENKIPTILPPPELVHVTSQSLLESECFSKPLCVMAVLPNRMDTTSKKWQKYIGVLKEVIDSQRTMGYGWVWIEGLSDPKFEECFGVGGFGYPALVAYSHKKKAYSLMTSPFVTASIKQFLISLGSRSVQTHSISGEIPTFKDAQAWDGADFAKSDL
ncbi:putative protein disulfide-isomerase A6 [Thelohanellus kitauei]|uniref:Thioredoxin domain-containing protein n=1 Tax=Thelohanellus kitauei TaxID=669202 RepID=A0A0C2MGX3_THEKT|nr:putative protein disulfide-isomerase A6 [Thelohanellus kitauei]